MYVLPIHFVAGCGPVERLSTVRRRNGRVETEQRTVTVRTACAARDIDATEPNVRIICGCQHQRSLTQHHGTEVLMNKHVAQS